MKRCVALAAGLTVAAAAANAQMAPGLAPGAGQAGAKPSYAVDGRALGARMRPDGARDYKCSPSEQFNGFTWCQRAIRDFGLRGTVETTHSILHGKDGTIVYVNRHQQPAFLDAADADREIQRHARQLGEQPRIVRLPRRAGAPDAMLATWGRIELEALDADSVKMLAEGKSPRKGFLIDHLGNLTRSAQDGLPIYRILGGAGFAWAASFDARGRGALRLVAIDSAALQPETPAVAADRAAAPAGSEERQANDHPPPAKADEPDRPAAPEITIARLQSELSTALQEKADAEHARTEAETATRVARADAEIARKVMAQLEEARGRQPVASVAPVALLDRSNLVPLAGGAVAILLLGMWLGGRVAHRRAALAVGVTAVGLQALEPMPSAPEPAGAVDQDRLVEALGKELGVQEPATPKDSAPDATPLTPAADAPVTANGPVVAAPPATPAAPTAPALPAPPETKTEVSASR